MEARDVKARSGHRSPGFFLLALIMVALCQASAQPGIRIRSLAFEGVTALSVNELRENFLTKEGQGLSRSLLNSDVRNLIARYNAEGYVFCSAEPVVKYDDDSSSAAVTLFVKEGNPVVIGSVEVIANPPMVVSPEDGPAGLSRGDVFHPGMVEHLRPADVLVDSMRGRHRTWTRIRVNLQHVPEEIRPPQEPLEVDYDPWAGMEWEGRDQP